MKPVDSYQKVSNYNARGYSIQSRFKEQLFELFKRELRLIGSLLD
jgi:hypothetical protein